MRVLVVEDEAKLGVVLRDGLRRRGMGVDVASTGEEAVMRATATDYDLILLDVMLPGYDGFEVCRRLRASDVWSPTLMLTALDDVGDRVRGLDSGADDYLPKPFSFDELLARIRALIRRGSPPRPTVLTVGNLRLDPAERRVWRGEEELSLTAREFSMLELFMRHPGEVLSRFELLEHVWDDSYENRSNVIEVYVGYLREKLDRETIETVRGAGYRLRA
ncbi:MAG: response regulator transcription factor [Solirubrobacterales bacterium]|nr:response regulator transcription factor [Solirubrobacterales bacterium]MBV9421793.1 response regulator transcription factor [Solirubrobacterales bacterium]MBV9798728.1 response regulator transcription factor [Solirubrobacterales bacterium]